jgi:hypothetical protein
MQPTGVLETAKATNPLQDLLQFGQSLWLDYIRRDLISSGELKTKTWNPDSRHWSRRFTKLWLDFGLWWARLSWR